MMAILLSELISKIDGIEEKEVRFVREKKFDRMIRVTSESDLLTCIVISEEKYIKKIKTNVTMVITNAEISEKCQSDQYGLCICNQPKLLFNRILDYLNRNTMERKENTIGKDCEICSSAIIADHNVTIGNHVIIEDFAVVYPNTEIGDYCVIRAGAKIGIQDYNFYSDGGKMVHLYHAGGVIIENNAEIGYNSVVGKGLYRGDNTIIGENTKISHNCCIGHDVHLGRNNMIYSGTVIGGYTETGENTSITMNSTVKNGLKIGKDVKVCMGSNVILNIRDGSEVFGNPATKMKI